MHVLRWSVKIKFFLQQTHDIIKSFTTFARIKKFRRGRYTLNLRKSYDLKSPFITKKDT